MIEVANGGEAAPTHRAIMRSISGLLLATFVATLSTNILATALPRILSSLDVGVNEYTWVVTTYILVLTVSVPVWGKLADLWDKKKLLQLVLLIYLLSSIVAGSAQNATMLIVGRAFQGLGTGGLAALGQTVLAAIISPRLRGRYNGYSGATFALGTVSGPLIGGLLVNTPGLGWRACFFASLPFGALSWYLIQRHLHVPTIHRKVRIDYLGAVLIVVDATVLIVWVSLAGTDFPWWSWQTAAAVGSVVVLTAIGVRVELTAPEPLVRLTLFRIPAVALASGASFISGIVAFASPVFLAQYLQLGRGLAPVKSGLATIPMIAGIFAASWVIGRLITYTGRMKPFLLFGAVAQIVGVAAFGLTDVRTHLGVLWTAMFILGMGIGVLQQNVVLFAQNVIPVEDLGTGSAAVQFSRFLGGALGVSALGAYSAARVSTHVTKALDALGVHLSASAAQQLPAIHSMSTSMRHAYEASYGMSFTELFAVLAPLVLLPLLAIAFMRDVSLADRPRRSTVAETETETETAVADPSA